MKSTPPPCQATHLSSGELAKQTQLSRGAIRLYEKYGLITPVFRTEAGYRAFSPDTVVTLNAIKVACKAGFSLADVGELLSLVNADTFSPKAIKSALHSKINEVDKKILHLQQFKQFMTQVAKDPKMLQDPDCDAMLELAMMAASADR